MCQFQNVKNQVSINQLLLEIQRWIETKHKPVWIIPLSYKPTDWSPV